MAEIPTDGELIRRLLARVPRTTQLAIAGASVGALVLTIGFIAWYFGEDRTIRRHQEEFLAVNCPGVSSLAECEARVAKWSEPPPQGRSPTLPLVPAPVTSLAGALAKPLTAEERSRALSAIGELETLVRQRANSIHRETEAGCAARQARVTARVTAAENKVVGDRLNQPTRFASRAPDLGQTVSGAVGSCVDGCLLPDDSDPDDVVGREMVTRGCRQAATALEDLAAELRASK